MNKVEEIEAKNQFVGIRIILNFGFLFYIIVWFSVILIEHFTIGSERIVAGLFIVFPLCTLIHLGRKGLRERKSYAIPVNKANLILFSFFVGLIPTGIILLVIFWPRFDKLLVKEYLNYGKTKQGQG